MDDAMLKDQGKGDVAGFTEVDHAPNAGFFVEFLDAANALPGVQPTAATPGGRVRRVAIQHARSSQLGWGTD